MGKQFKLLYVHIFICTFGEKTSPIHFEILLNSINPEVLETNQYSMFLVHVQIFLSTDIYNFKISVASKVLNEDQTGDDVDHNKLYQSLFDE